MYAAIDYDNPEPVTLDTGFFTKDIGAKVGTNLGWVGLGRVQLRSPPLQFSLIWQ